MTIEMLMAIIILAFVFMLGTICALGWLATEHKLDEERERNRRLSKEKEHLAIKNAKMRFQLNLIREKLEVEMKQ